jgi:hypothetical protein
MAKTTSQHLANSPSSATCKGTTARQRECPNCKGAVPSGRPLFCSTRCEQTAGLVRYARRKLSNGTYDRPDIAEAIRIRAAILASGYYDEKERRASLKIRQELLARSNGHCEKCGCAFRSEGDARFTVQHRQTNEGMILEAWCYRCNMDHADSMLKPATGEALSFLQSLMARIHAPKPLRQCDDPDHWPAISRQLRRLAVPPDDDDDDIGDPDAGMEADEIEARSWGWLPASER